MLISLNWLRDYIDIDLSVEALCDTLTMLGLEIEAVKRPGDAVQGVVVGQIESIDPHPDADKLVVCKTRVAEDGEPLQIVCGATNMKVGDKVPTAVAGGELPGGFAIARRKMRGVESQGMMCSAKELGMGEDHAGLMILSPDAPIGHDMKPLLGLDDVVLEIEVTPNRGDWASMFGVARELAAKTGNPLRLPEVSVVEGDTPTSSLAEVTVDEPELCPRYVGRVIQGVTIGPSPQWLAQKLTAAGQRPINNVVDITNFVLLETGHPLHAFDLAKLRRNRIIVRRAGEGETLATLDGETRPLTPERLVIADGEGPVALAGVMGGADSEVAEGTTDIFLESAMFDPVTIRSSSRAYNLVTESSQRFQRGADPEMARFASERAVQLILDLAGGTLAKDALDVYPKPFVPNEIALRYQRAERLLGTSVPGETQIEILKSLGFRIKEVDPSSFMVETPPWRHDCHQEADLIEEIARLWGYDQIPQHLPRVRRSEEAFAPEHDRKRRLRNYLVGAGLCEAMSWTFTSPQEMRQAGLGEGDHGMVRLANPLSENYTAMRPSLAPAMLNIVSRNVRNNRRTVAVFEIGPVYKPNSGNELPDQHDHLAIALSGTQGGQHWSASGHEADIYDLKGYVEGIADFLNLPGFTFDLFENGLYEPGHAGQIGLNGQSIGTLGSVRRKVLEAFEIDQPVQLLELDLAPLLSATFPRPQFEAIPAYPPSLRDMAVIVDNRVPAGELCKAAEEAGGKLLQEASLFDIYTGKPVPEGKKSVALSLVFQSNEKTLTDKATQKAWDKILQRLQADFGAELR